MNKQQTKLVQKMANQLGEEKKFANVKKSGDKSLQLMRKNSCYPASRSFARIIYLFLSVLLVITLLSGVIGSFMDGNVLTAIGAILISIVIFFFIRLMYESLQMIADIADSSVIHVELLRQINRRNN
jgi:magnesium-transporting ATPase (P-type)